MNCQDFITAVDARQRNFADEDFSGADFSGLSYTGIDFSHVLFVGANLSGSNFSNPEWNRSQRSSFYFPELEIDYSTFDRANFTGADLSSGKFEDIYLGGANFQQANLQGTSFLQARLKGADFQSACFIDTHVNGQHVNTATKFQQADIQGCNFQECILPGANFKMTDAQNTNYHKSVLARARFNETNLSKANLTNTNLEQTSFVKANLTGAKLNGACLKQTQFKGANLYLADFSDAEWPDLYPPSVDRETRIIPKEWEQLNYQVPEDQVLAVQSCFQNFPVRQLQDLTGDLGLRQRWSLGRVLGRKITSVIQLANAAEMVDYGGAARINTGLLHRMVDQRHIPMMTGDHEHQDLTGRNLVGTFFDRANLTNSNLSGQNLAHIVVNDSNWQGTNLRGADLQGAVLSNVDLAGADLRDANLSGAILVNCNLDGVKLDGVILDNTRMVQSTLKNTKITKAFIKDFLIERSLIDLVAFDGGPGDGVQIHGMGLYDSVMTNSHFAGNGQLSGIELEGSLMIADGGGLLNNSNVYISPMSEWREQRILLVQDDIIGPMRIERIVETGQIKAPETNFVRSMLDRLGGRVRSPLDGMVIYDMIQDDQGEMGKIPALEHLARQEIGYHPMPALKSDWQPAQEKKLVLPYGA